MREGRPEEAGEGEERRARIEPMEATEEAMLGAEEDDGDDAAATDGDFGYGRVCDSVAADADVVKDAEPV